METAETSAVITTWNNASSIRCCLESVRRTGINEIVLCDCGSSDSTVKIVEQEYSDVVILSGCRRLSFAQARNLAVKRTRGEFVLFLEGDWCAEAGSVLELYRTLSSASAMRVAIAVPCLRDEDGTIQIGHNVRRFPTAKALCMELLLLYKLFPQNVATRQYRMLDFAHDQNCPVDHACGSFILARREALLAAGGYDEGYEPAWMEDVDLHQRLKKLSWQTIFCSCATARHIGRETTRHLIVEDRYDDFYWAVLRYCRTYLPHCLKTVRASMTAGMLLRILFSYGVPAVLRARLLRRYHIYVSDKAIQRYKRMYFRTFLLALKGAQHVSPDKSTAAFTGLSGRPARVEWQTLSPRD